MVLYIAWRRSFSLVQFCAQTLFKHGVMCCNLDLWDDKRNAWKESQLRSLKIIVVILVTIERCSDWILCAQRGCLLRQQNLKVIMNQEIWEHHFPIIMCSLHYRAPVEGHFDKLWENFSVPTFCILGEGVRGEFCDELAKLVSEWVSV